MYLRSLSFSFFFIQGIADTQADILTVDSLLFEDALPWVSCPPGEKRLPLSKKFWPAYQEIKAYREVMHVPKSDNSLEVKAQNNLQSALRFYKDELGDDLPFVRTLIRDLREYKTLPKFTLRRLTSVNLGPDDLAGDWHGNRDQRRLTINNHRCTCSGCWGDIRRCDNRSEDSCGRVGMADHRWLSAQD